MRHLLGLIALSALLAALGGGDARAQTAPDCATVGPGGANVQCANCDNIANAGFSGLCTTAAATYTMTMKSMQLREQGTGTLVTIASGDQTFDAASVNAGATVGSYASGASVPAGTYDALVPTLSATWSYSASTTGGAAGSCATAAAGVNAGSTAATAQSVNLATLFTANPTFKPSNMTVSGGNVILTDSTQASLPVTVGGGTGMTVDIAFDAGSAAQFTYAAGTCNATNMGPLGVTVTFTKTGS